MPGYTPNIFKGRLFIFITFKRFTLSHELSQFTKQSRILLHIILRNSCPNYRVNVRIFVSDQEITSLNFVVEFLCFKSLFFHQQSLAGILWTQMSEILYLFPILKHKLGRFSFRISAIGYVIVLRRGVHLLITLASDLGFLV